MATQRIRRIGVILACCLVVGLIGVVPAMSHNADSRVSIHADDKQVGPNERVVFFGRLRNDHGRCERDRRIELVRKGQGVVDSDRTDNEGEWRIRHNPEPDSGRFFARFDGTGRFGYQNRHKCGADRSKVIRTRAQ
jgi:hypothetical protein